MISRTVSLINDLLCRFHPSQIALERMPAHSLPASERITDPADCGEVSGEPDDTQAARAEGSLTAGFTMRRRD